MGLFTKDIKTMEDLLLHGLQDVYYAEQQIIKSLPKMIEKATNRDLVAGLKEGAIPVGETVTVRGNRNRDQNKFEMKTIMVQWGGKKYDVYPERE